jgi:thiol-disulfide isomerase/thioredoxin
MRNIKLTLIIIGAVLVVTVGWLYISSKNAPIQKRPLPTKSETQLEKAPNFKLLDYDGKIVSLADFAGKPLLINSWAAWCPFCRQELPDFAKAKKEFGDKVVIIAIDRAESRDTAKKYTDELGVTNDLIFLLDPSDSFYQSIGGFSMPETIFVDKNENIVEHKRGPMDVNEMRQKIQKLLSL